MLSVPLSPFLFASLSAATALVVNRWMRTQLPLPPPLSCTNVVVRSLYVLSSGLGSSGLFHSAAPFVEHLTFAHSPSPVCLSVSLSVALMRESRPVIYPTWAEED